VHAVAGGRRFGGAAFAAAPRCALPGTWETRRRFNGASRHVGDAFRRWSVIALSAPPRGHGEAGRAVCVGAIPTRGRIKEGAPPTPVGGWRGLVDGLEEASRPERVPVTETTAPPIEPWQRQFQNDSVFLGSAESVRAVIVAGLAA